MDERIGLLPRLTKDTTHNNESIKKGNKNIIILSISCISALFVGAFLLMTNNSPSKLIIDDIQLDAHGFNCVNKSFTVLKGYDVVEFFSLDSDEKGVVGSEEYSYELRGFTFLFSSAKNLETFSKSPYKYTPRFGGFCAWGIGTEFEPNYGWNPGSLGPDGDPYDAWAVVNDELFILHGPPQLAEWQTNTTKYIEIGKKRWVAWFGDEHSGSFNTNCFCAMNEYFASGGTSYSCSH